MSSSRRQPQNLSQSGVGVARLPIVVDDPDALAGRLDQTAVAAFAAAIFLFLDLGPAPGGMQPLE